MNKYLIGLIVFFLCTLTGYTIYLHTSIPKIAYIHNAILFAKFKGSQESKKILDKDVYTLKSNLDTLTNVLNQEYLKYKREESSLSVNEKQSAQEYLSKRKRDLYNYKVAAENKLKEKENSLNEAIINQLNTYIEQYGQNNDYDYIIGATENGSIMFSKESKDITNDVLVFINSKYNDK